MLSFRGLKLLPLIAIAITLGRLGADAGARVVDAAGGLPGRVGDVRVGGVRDVAGGAGLAGVRGLAVGGIRLVGVGRLGLIGRRRVGSVGLGWLGHVVIGCRGDRNSDSNGRRAGFLGRIDRRSSGRRSGCRIHHVGGDVGCGVVGDGEVGAVDGRRSVVANRCRAGDECVGGCGDGCRGVGWLHRVRRVDWRSRLVIATRLARCDRDGAGCHRSDDLGALSGCDRADGCGCVGRQVLGHSSITSGVGRIRRVRALGGIGWRRGRRITGAGRVDRRVARLRGVDRRIARPRGIDWRMARLSGVDGVGARLGRIDWVRARLWGVDWVGAGFRRVNRVRARLGRIDRVGARLGRVHRRRARLRGVNWIRAGLWIRRCRAGLDRVAVGRSWGYRRGVATGWVRVVVVVAIVLHGIGGSSPKEGSECDRDGPHRD